MGRDFFFALAAVIILSMVCPWLAARKAKAQSNAIVTTLSRSEIDSAVIPDWPIRELFFHMSPDLKDGQTNLNFEKTGLEVKDRLSTSQLKIWGRRKTILGELTPFDEIDPTYWQRADFSYFFLAGDEENSHMEHTRIDPYSGLAEYRDLHVNRSQALKIWPNEFIAINEAAEKAYQQTQETQTAGFTGGFAMGSLDAATKIIDDYAMIVAKTSVPIFGKRPLLSFEEISKSALLADPDFHIRDGALYYGVEQGPRFTDVSIRQRDLVKAIEDIKKTGS